MESLAGRAILEAGELSAAQGRDAGHAQRMEGRGRELWTRRAVLEPGGSFGAEAGQPLLGGRDGDPEPGGDLGDGPVEFDDTPDHPGPAHRGELGIAMRVHAVAVFGPVPLSQPHLSNSSQHEQPVGTSHLAGRFLTS